MNTPLKEAVREHVASKSLDDERIGALEAMLAEGEPEPRRSPVAGMAALGLVAAVLLGVFVWAPTSAPDVPMDIAQEVAKNHLKLKPLEVEATQVSGASEFFAQIDIELLERSSVLDAKPWALRGGRHCSIQGEDAAQLRYTDARTGDVVSVYMAPYDASALGHLPDVGAGERPLMRQVRGMDVMIWVEKGVLVAATPVK